MEPPGTILSLNNSVTQGVDFSQSPNTLNETEGGESGVLSSSDPLQGVTSNADSTPEVSTSDLPNQQVTRIEDDDFGPRFKDQTNSVAYSGNGNNTADCRWQAENVVAMNVDDTTENNKHDTGSGPSYKDQVNDSSNEVFVSSNHPSNSGPTNSNRSNSLPIVHGILIPPEMLTEEERRTSGHEVVNNSQPIRSGTYHQNTTTSESLDVPTTSDDRPTPPEKVAGKSAMSSSDEPLFWMKIIFGAIILNTFLVAAVIVGTFCGIGLCSSSSSNSLNSSGNSMSDGTAPIPSPTFAPLMVSPSNIPSPAPLPLLTSTPPPVSVTFPSDDSLTTGAPTISVATFPPSTSPSMVPSTIAIGDRLPTDTTASQQPNVAVFIIPAVLLEFIFVLTCLYYYYKRKKKRQQKTELEQPNEESGNVESNSAA